MDNRVAQTVTAVSLEEVPVDVTLIVDVAGSTQDVIEKLRQDTRKILGLLRGIDPVRITRSTFTCMKFSASSRRDGDAAIATSVRRAVFDPRRARDCPHVATRSRPSPPAWWR